MLKNNEIAFSIQKQRYINFWKIRFPTLLKEFFEIKFKTNSKLSQSIPAIQKIKTYQKAISEKERKNSVSAFLYRSKLEKLFITLQFQHNKKYNLLLGEIPKIDDKGLFEIDGNNRVIIGYLGKPLGLNFSEKDEKYKAYFRTQSRRSRGLKIIIKNLKKKPKLSIKCGSEELDSRVVKKLLGKKIYTEFEKKYDIGEPDAKRGKKFSVDKKIEEIKKCYISKSGRIYTNIKLKETYKKLNLISTESPYIAIEDIIATLHWLSDKFTKSSKLTPDEKYSLENKQLYLIDDLLEAKVWDAMEIIWSYLTKSLRTENLTIKEFIEILQSILNTKRDCKSLRTFTHEIINLFISHPLSRPINTNNLLETASFQRRISLIDLEDNISDKALYFDRKARDLHWSHYGRLCPIDTPQGDDVGLVYSLSKNAIVEDGIIKAPYYRIEGGQKISKKADYLSPSEEKDFWIAYSGQEEKILRGEDVFARKGSEELVLKSPQEVQYIDYSVEQPFSWASLLVPFLCHNDANRVLMASNSMRQALPLLEKDTPWIKTGYEKKLVDESGFKNDENAEFTIKDGEFAFGQNLLVGYLSYKGLNFEDAIVISETAAKKLTSIQFRIFKEKVIANYIDFIQQNRKVVKQEIMTNDEEEIKNFNLKHINIPKNIQKLGIDGIIIEGKTFVEGDVLVRKFVKQTLAGEYSDVSYIAPRGSHGTVFKIEKEKLVTEDMYIKITAKIERPVKVGDKLANRHGGKGVVSAIIPDNKMPYFLDEKTKQNSPLEVILNPLGVFSRLNIGQLFETHLGLVLSRKNQKNKNVILSPLEQYSFDKLKCEFKNVNLPEDGKLLVKFHDNNKNIWESAGEVVVGYQYIMRLEHIAEEKLNSRDLPGEKYYSKISQQPTRGKEDYGGQRIGEMEVWALVAHNANNILREMLTLKSDNPHEKRVELKNVFASKTMPVSYIPEFLRVFLIYLCGLGIDMQLFDSANNSIDILSRDTKCLPLNFEPEMIQNATLSVANLYDKEKCEGWSCGEVSNLIIGYDTEGYKDDGLFSQVIFGPIKDNKCKCRFRSKKAIDNQKCPNCKVVIGSSKMRNYRMGYIELPQPIVNPLFIIQVAKLLLIPEASLKKLLFNKKYLLSDLNLLSDLIISFKGNKNTQRFLELLRGIGIVYENPMEIAEEILKRKIKEIVINDRFMVMEKLLIYKECTKYLIKYLPVIPPVYRPYTVISGGTQLRICGDINSHYLDILAFCNKKNREKIDSVGIQKSVAQLFDKKIWQPKMNSSGEHRETLLSKIIGNDTAKEGFFRKYMLGKRVDYSGRAVIVPGVNLGMDECLLPIEMVIEIYRPLFEKSFSKKEIKKIEKYRTAISPEMIYKMNKVISKYPVLINRQPTLHNLNIQAFYPKITMDSVIHFQPLVTSGFNADYDGDTVAVHVPVSRDACDESKQMLASNNIISKADGSITVNVSQDIALGIYKYTGILAGRKNFEQQLFGDVNNRITEPVGKKILYKLLSDSYKLLYEKNRGQVIPGQDEQALEKTRGEFKKIVEWIKDTGFNYATKSGFSLGIEDFVGKDNSPSIDMLLKSSARSDETTLNQITDKRGAMQRIGTSGKFSVQKTTEIEASLLGGMNLGEIFISCYGSRKTLVDKKVGVADCGYITRQMVELLCDVKLNRQICTSEQTINHPKFELISIKSDDSNGIFNDKDIEIIKQTKLFERNWKYNWWGSKEWDDFIGKLPKDQYIILENEFKSPPIGFLIGRYKPKQKKYSLKYVLANINLRKFKINSGNEIRDEQGKLLINLASGESLIGIEFLRDYWSPIEMSKMRFEKLKYIVKGDKDKQRVKQAIEKIRAYIAVQVLSPMTQYISKNIITCDSSDGGCVDCYHRFGEEIPANIDQIAAGIIAAQSLGEPLTQNVMRTFHTGGAASEEEAVIEKINQVLECRHPSMLKLLWALKSNNPNEIIESQFGVVDTLYDLYKELRSGKEIDIRHIELLVRQMVRRYQSQSAITLKKSALNSPDWLAKISFEEMRKNLPEFAANNKIDNLTGLKQRVIFGKVK